VASPGIGQPDDGCRQKCHREDMEIRQLDVFDDAGLARFHEVTERAEGFERPHHSGWSLPEARMELRRRDPAERGEAWAAYDGDTMVGGATLWFSLQDNLTKCWAGSESTRTTDAGVPAPVAIDGIGNAETNAHMVDINVRLGFEAVEVVPIFELRLPDAARNAPVDTAATTTGQPAQVRAATS